MQLPPDVYHKQALESFTSPHHPAFITNRSEICGLFGFIISAGLYSLLLSSVSQVSVLYMSIQSQIKEKLQQALQPQVLEVVNESSMHNVPAGSESHFKVTIVAEEFHGKMLIARHRRVNAILAEELDGQIHALALHTLTPDEYFEQSGQVPESPQCMGGSKAG